MTGVGILLGITAVMAGMIHGTLPGIMAVGTMVGTIPGIMATMAGMIHGTIAIMAGAIPTTGQVVIHIIMAVVAVAVMPTSAQVLSEETVPPMAIMAGLWQAIAVAGTA